jgi:N-acetylneuraminic acid mutarotase
MGAGFSEPSPRWGHFSAAVDPERKLCVWGGRTKDLSSNRKNELASSVHSFDPVLECWAEIKTSGGTPLELYEGACASAGHHLYVYGGTKGLKLGYGSSLHQLDTKSWRWKEISAAGPMKKKGCGMVAFDSKLVLFGGFGFLSEPTQPGSVFMKDRGLTEGGWTNELHVFDLNEGEQRASQCA